MEEVPGVLTQGRVFFKTKQKLQTCKKGKFSEQRCWTRATEKMPASNKEYHNASPCYESLDIPLHAMQFLCRSWSPTASTLLRTFSSSNNQILDFQVNHSLERHEEKVDQEIDVLMEEEGIAQVDDAKRAATQSNRYKLWTRILVQRSVPSILQSCKLLYIDRRIKEWLREKSLTDILKRKERKKKEEVRLLTAKIRAALSVTQLAAAIAGYSATGCAEVSKVTSTNEEMKMGNVVAYATALLASACAEAAESIGANKAHVSSAVNSGLATQSPADIITLTAAAATSLRGAETLNSRATTKEAVKLAAKLSVITPSGHKVLRLVSIHLKHRQLMLSLEKKYLGVLTTSKEYAILQVIREQQGQGHFLLGIKCSNGDVKLLFEDKEQSLLWKSIISKNLQILEPSWNIS
ncbi:hypothetical protein JCGZ_00592 [Jatropha curcas]|uniref:VAN3-binding protein-like auxin canalisation domain-containing protein n=1 Tax=Jatropha curcas TaxID=180498 RepID=A0A067JP77_JATCU|nr:hypothetical protein JCGZ_00592 [Jatropha curcas]